MPLIFIQPYTALSTGNGVGDSFFDNVTLLMHMDGVNGGTSFPDVRGHAITVSNVTTQSSGAKFAQSAQFAGTSTSYLSTPSATGFDFGSGDFTIEYWIKLTSIPDFAACPIGKWPTSWLVYMNPNGLLFYINGGTVAVTSTSPTWNMGEWYHIAITRQSSTWNLWVNGESVAANSNASAITAGAEPVVMGINNANARNFVAGMMDDVRITKGVARYTSTFTPPTTAFPDSVLRLPLNGTWDTTRTAAGTVYDPNGLTVTIGALHSPRSQNSISSGSKYFEIHIDTWANRYGPIIGVMDEASESYGSTGAFSLWVSEALIIKASGNVGYGVGLAIGDTLGVLLDMDARQLTFYKNGVSMGVAVTNIPPGSYYAFAAAAGSNYGTTVTANFGATAFM